MYKLIIVILFIFPFCSCKKEKQFTIASSNDYLIYDEVIKHVMKNKTPNHCYIENKTFFIPELMKELKSRKNLYDKYASYGIAEFNACEILLKASGFKKINTKSQISLIQSENNINAKSENDIIVCFSQITYNDNKTKAALYYSVKKIQQLGGETTLIGASKVGKDWQITLDEYGWVY